jgi:hypothetical protein
VKVAQSDSKLFPEAAVKSASTVPAYALVFINLLVVLAVATQVPLGVAIVVAVAVVLLSAYVIWVVELRARRSVFTTSSGQAERLEEVRDLDKPIRSVFEDLVGEDDVYVVYSSTEVMEFRDQLGDVVKPGAEDFTYGSGAEKRVTAIPDAIGVGSIHNLLYLGGKRKRVRSITSWPDDFNRNYWEASLVLIGSGKSNRITTEALRDFESPFRFSDDFNAIVDAKSPGNQWPARKEDLQTMDYGIVVKLKVKRGERTNVYLVIAGVGPYGTQAGCHFLEREIQRIHKDFDTSPFAYLLSVKRDSAGGAFDPKVEQQCSLPVVQR